MFCLFADDTGIFEPRDIFFDFLETRTGEDGADLGPWLAQLFQVLDTREGDRVATLDEDLNRFPYVNGRLFEGPLRIPSFDGSMRRRLLDACRFDWSNISPAIFGALFQSVMDPAERRRQGAHYTTEKNILKVIEPLFLDDLRAEFERLRGRRDSRRRADLRRFQERLGQMTFFDPACGCGNFLIIAYRELRELEIEVLKELHRTGDRQLDALASELSPRRRGPVPRHRDRRVSGAHRGNRAVDDGPHHEQLVGPRVRPDVHADSAGDVAVHRPRGRARDGLGRSAAAGGVLVRVRQPPFGGAKYQSKLQRAQVRRIAALGGTGGTLDHVTSWFIKAGEYVAPGTRIGFVATNSITQGEQVAQLWPILFERCGLEIAFAHRTFAWGSDARGKAHVHVVIIGFDVREAAHARKRLFSYPDINGDPEETRHAVLSPYLFDAGGLADPHLTVREERAPVNGLLRLIIGSKPIDGGNYILKTEETRAEFIAAEPAAEPYVRPYIGAREYLQGGGRWILALHDAPPNVLTAMPKVRERIAAVRSYREASRSAPTRKLAATPTLYHVNVIPTASFLVIPKVSSERREYVPVGWLNPPTVPSDLVFVLQNATLSHFALLTSAMHMAWLRHIGGRLKSDYRYSIGLVYNTFPMPPRRRGPLQARPVGASRSRRPRRVSRRHPGGPLRPRPDAAPAIARPSGTRPRCGPAVSRQGLRLRTRTRRAPVHALREDADAAGDGDQEAEAAKAVSLSATQQTTVAGVPATRGNPRTEGESETRSP